MMSLAGIKQASGEAAEAASAAGMSPYVPWDADEIDEWPPFPFPELGDLEPEGWQELTELQMFVDSSGFGQEGEGALTIRAFIEKCKAIRLDDHRRGFAIGDVGQFQLYVKVYEPV